MAADNSNKHKTREIIHNSTEPIEGLKDKTFGTYDHPRKLVKKITKQTIVEVACNKPGKTSRKKAKKIIIDRVHAKQGKSKNHKKAGRPSPNTPSLINWEPTFRILTGQYLLDFIGEI